MDSRTRLDGRTIGRNGLAVVSSQILLTPGLSVTWPARPERVFLLVTNAGDLAGNAGGILQIRPSPDQATVTGFVGTNGHPLAFGGSLQLDRYFPWDGQLILTGVAADVNAVITEVYDAG